jgi:hypothetical protein
VINEARGADTRRNKPSTDPIDPIPASKIATELSRNPDRFRAFSPMSRQWQR